MLTFKSNSQSVNPTLHQWHQANTNRSAVSGIHYASDLHCPTDGECFPTKRDLISHLFLPLSLHDDIFRFLQIILLWSRNHGDFNFFHQIRCECANSDDGSFQLVCDGSKFGMYRRRGIDGDWKRDRVVVNPYQSASVYAR